MAMAQPHIHSCARLPPPYPRFRTFLPPGSIWLKYTAKWLSLVQKFSGLATLPGRFQVMEICRVNSRWKCTTTATYWAATMCARKIMGLAKGAELASDSKVANHYQHLANSELHDYCRSLTDCSVLEIWTTTSEVAGLIICVSYILGQRVSDMAQLAILDLTLELQNSTICITVRRGKVIQYIRPYVLHLSTTCPVAQALWKLRNDRLTHGAEFLFSTSNTLKERLKIGDRIRNTLKLTHPDLELRSVRRGGLERMAANGVPLQEM